MGVLFVFGSAVVCLADCSDAVSVSVQWVQRQYCVIIACSTEWCNSYNLYY